MATEPDIPAPEEPGDSLTIGTAVCPHCGAARRSVVHKTGGISRCIVRYWQVEWECRSYIILSDPPRLSLSKRCTGGDIGVSAK
jgi:hypothetical protein